MSTAEKGDANQRDLPPGGLNIRLARATKLRTISTTTRSQLFGFHYLDGLIRPGPILLLLLARTLEWV